MGQISVHICWFDHLKMELEAHTWRASSTHVYYSHTKYELLTPSLNGRTRKWVSKNRQDIVIKQKHAYMMT